MIQKEKFVNATVTYNNDNDIPRT